MELTDLNNAGVASGFTIGRPVIRPITVSTRNFALANADNFYDTPGVTDWNLQVANSNSAGVLGGFTVAVPGSSRAEDRNFPWTWNGASITRLPPVRDGEQASPIASMVGPADNGRYVVTAGYGEGLQAREGTNNPEFPYQTAYMARSGGITYSRAIAMAANGAWVGAATHQSQDAATTEIVFIRAAGGGSYTFSQPLNLKTCRCSVVGINNAETLLVQNDDGSARLVSRDANVALPRADSSRHRVVDINNRGDVAGTNGRGPFVIIDGQLIQLATDPAVAAGGWRLGVARAINDNRQILAWGWNASTPANPGTQWVLITLK